MRSDELERVLRGLDPARDVPPLAGPERREHNRLAILVTRGTDGVLPSSQRDQARALVLAIESALS